MADGPDLTLLRQRIREIGRRVGNGGEAAPPPSDLGPRVDRLEHEVAEIATMLARVEPMIVRMDATLPGLATKVEMERLRAQVSAQLAEKPSKTYLWALLAALLLAAALGPTVISLIA